MESIPDIFIVLHNNIAFEEFTIDPTINEAKHVCLQNCKAKVCG